MARKMIVWREDGSRPVLTETAADDEQQLQELIQENPDLLPIDDFGMTGPLMVVGRETTLPSGSVDLVALTRGGEVLVVEFKTGPQNTDFRHVLAQLLDYGSDLWRLSYEEFESTVAARYFGGDHCRDERVRNKTSLAEAAQAIWSDLSEEEATSLRDRLVEQLGTGSFHYLVVAQRFTPTIAKTVDYLNAVTSGLRFYAVELVKFSADGLAAFESRTVLKPERPAGTNGSSSPVNEVRFLEGIEDERYREVLRELLEACRGLDLRFGWGVVGTSIRVPTADRAQPLTIGWLFPSGGRGWMGLSDLTLGFDTTSAAGMPSIAAPLETYMSEVAAIPGAKPVNVKNLRAFHLAPTVVVQERRRITEAIANLVSHASSQGGER